VRLGRLARALVSFEPRRVEIAFNEGGSFAGTYRGHRTDCALAAGLLGWDTDDPRIPQAINEARARGVDIAFAVARLETDHPNTVRFRLRGPRGEHSEVVGTSEGGGAVRVSRLDGMRTDLDGQWPVLLARLRPGAPTDDLVRALVELSDGARVRANDGNLLTLELSAPLGPQALETAARRPEVVSCRQVEPVSLAPRPGASRTPLFSTAADLLYLAAQRRAGLSDLAVSYEAGRLGWTPAQIRTHAGRMVSVMRQALDRGLSEELPLSGGIVKQGGCRLHEAVRLGRTVSSGTMTRAAAYAMAVNEVSASLGLIVAAPTAGSCGVVPGALFAAAEDLGIADRKDALVDALLAAGAVGAVFAQRATFLAELCGCQVESGAAAAMAAAAVVEMKGGSPRQSLDAASISLQNILGMECDPVAGLMEVPCITRNALGAVNALMSADIVLAGVESAIPFDEVVDAVYETGRFRPVQCNGTAGLAATPSGRALAVRVRNWEAQN
jgi:L-serine dehydratase